MGSVERVIATTACLILNVTCVKNLDAMNAKINAPDAMELSVSSVYLPHAATAKKSTAQNV